MSTQTAGYTDFHEVPERAAPTGRRLATLSLTALGVVYGDIGTSPLYALRECFKPEYGLAPTPQTVFGVLSLILWTLVIVICVKYAIFVLRADNRGEGGILALLALLLQQERRAEDKRRRLILIMLGLFGAALLLGESIITPAISVLSAVEGIEVNAPTLAPYVMWISMAIIFGLFMAQRFGTARVGTALGPIMMIWFITISVLGIRSIAEMPSVLKSVNPWYAIQFFSDHGTVAFFTLGAVVLVVTGAEALYADMGHFGKRPIRVAWFAVVLPSLLLNYFGQGSLLLRDPRAAENPFFLMAPEGFRWPLVFIAASAAVVASQALISGSFSLIQQSVQLGYSPRMQIIHTSKQEAGQIYIPEVNKLLMIGCLLLILGFRTSSNLTAAYGIAVTGAMTITSILFAVVAHQRWNWSLPAAVATAALFLTIDLSFLSANLAKVMHGGWVPLLVAVCIYTLMSTWKRGRSQLNEIQREGAMPLDTFLESLSRRPPLRVRGTAVFMTSSPEGVPVVLLHHLKHNKMLHETVVLLSVQTRGIPEVPVEKRVTIEDLGNGFFKIVAAFGFMQTAHVPDVLKVAEQRGVPMPVMDTSYFLGRERLVIAKRAKMWRWRKKLFAVMSRNARSATEFFQIPPNRVVELGAQIEF